MKHIYIILYMLMQSLSLLGYTSEGFNKQLVDDVIDKKWNNLKAAVRESKLIAADAATFDVFGYSVSLSGDRALIGAVLDDDNGSNSGSAYIFDFDGSKWTQSSKLIANDGAAGDQFGFSVSLSGDRALIGVIHDDDNGGSSGSAYVFEFDGSNWTQTSKLTANDGAIEDQFGYSVSLLGNRALVGAYFDDDNGIDSGSTYVFDYDGSNWMQASKLNANDGSADNFFGSSVSLATDRALIGAWGDDDQGNRSGSAYVFDYDGNNWIQKSKLTATDGSTGDRFGISVSLSDDRALIGAYLDNINGINSGSAYIFDYDALNWVQTSKLTASDGANDDQFGYSVSLLGNKALIGAITDSNDNGSKSGSAYVFDLKNNNWIQTSKITTSDGSANDAFGASVSISGYRAIIGAYQDDDSGSDSGSAYILNLDQIFENGFE